ncbi:RadC-like JAB domain-containing protein [Sphingomonas laterariae]|uniref:RadC-like JAB domain-containing protein n=1 Tax=Edaphosphingomonas laterariae TaxID=861865 RepID=A0A239F1F8_9SPHN|nr:JAB domain-containing protein [Sphingomonas laterariae]SNS50766.1 RadC-like JAB domain-containing protein [Sphingomonas laterariae]
MPRFSAEALPGFIQSGANPDQHGVDGDAGLIESSAMGATRPWPAPIGTSDDAVALFASVLADGGREVLHVAHLDAAGRLLARSTPAPGDAETVDVPIRAIARDAILAGACGVIIAHNHPSGDPTPSRADLCATRRLADALAVLDIRLIDHLVLGGGCWRSFRAMGLL